MVFCLLLLLLLLPMNKTPHLAIYFSVTSLLLVEANSARDDNLRDLLHAFEHDLITL